MLGNHYISINGVELSNPTVNNIKYTNTENVKKSETARDIGNVTRLCQRTFSLTFQCSSFGREKILAFAKLTSVTMTFDGEQIDGRLRAGGANMKEGSEFFNNTSGLWTLTVSFMER